jgi:protein-L-isoaspartate(D-aspartate) O-methyltransferase
MTDFAAARRMMVDGQVRTSDVTDLRIVAAMLELPRERFVPEAKADLAYLDFDIVVKEATAGAPARRLLKPMVLAKMIQAAEVGASDRVLDVGCATGYSSALLSRLAASVVALEEDAALAREPRGRRGRQCHRRDRRVDRRLADRRPLRRHLRQRGNRDRAARARP